MCSDSASDVQNAQFRVTCHYLKGGVSFSDLCLSIRESSFDVVTVEVRFAESHHRSPGSLQWIPPFRLRSRTPQPAIWLGYLPRPDNGGMTCRAEHPLGHSLCHLTDSHNRPRRGLVHADVMDPAIAMNAELAPEG